MTNLKTILTLAAVASLAAALAPTSASAFLPASPAAASTPPTSAIPPTAVQTSAAATRATAAASYPATAVASNRNVTPTGTRRAIRAPAQAGIASTAGATCGRSRSMAVEEHVRPRYDAPRVVTYVPTHPAKAQKVWSTSERRPCRGPQCGIRHGRASKMGEAGSQWRALRVHRGRP